jgi:hypothetical protein
MSYYLGLIHYPIKNKRGDIVTTSVTNLDIHDIARSCRTFGMKNYFIVTPIQKQHELLGKILGHWEQDKANDYNPDRHDALSFIQLQESFQSACEQIKKQEGEYPLVCVTGANFKSHHGTENDLIAKLEQTRKPLFLLFGTGWGLADELVDSADFMLDPIFGIAEDGYNHLSVRSAVAIYMDRIARARTSAAT